jgi:hypothetical protein
MGNIVLYLDWRLLLTPKVPPCGTLLSDAGLISAPYFANTAPPPSAPRRQPRLFRRLLPRGERTMILQNVRQIMTKRHDPKRLAGLVSNTNEESVFLFASLRALLEFISYIHSHTGRSYTRGSPILTNSLPFCILKTSDNTQ